MVLQYTKEPKGSLFFSKFFQKSVDKCFRLCYIIIRKGKEHSYGGDVEKNTVSAPLDSSKTKHNKGKIKMTKKQIKEKNRKNRVMVGFNTGTRTFKSAKDYSRAEGKKICRNFEKTY